VGGDKIAIHIDHADLYISGGQRQHAGAVFVVIASGAFLQIGVISQPHGAFIDFNQGVGVGALCTAGKGRVLGRDPVLRGEAGIPFDRGDILGTV
jgi:hypothetical protein